MKIKDGPRRRRGARIGGEGRDDAGARGAGRAGQRGKSVHLEGEVAAGRGEAPRAKGRRGELEKHRAGGKLEGDAKGVSCEEQMPNLYVI